MSWMAPFPTRDTSLAAHWVTADAHYVRRGTAPATPPGWVAVCDTLVLPITGDDADYGDPRPPCETCAAAAPHPYTGQEERAQ